MSKTKKTTKKDSGPTTNRGKVALVTGGGVRVGRSICLSLARAGFCVAAHYHRSENMAIALKEEIQEMGRECALFGADLTSPGETQRLIENVGDHFGRLDVLVNNAALFIDDNANPKELENMRALNSEVPRALVQAAEELLKDSRGSIVNIADAFGLVAFRTHKKYSETKAALIEMTFDLAMELAPYSVNVNAVCPGTVLPKVSLSDAQIGTLRSAIPLGRIGRSEEVGEAVVFLAGADFITGQILKVDGGIVLKMEKEKKHE